MEVSLYHCPSRSRSRRLSVDGNFRKGVGHPEGGILCDYTINAGDGSLYPWFGNCNTGNGVAQSTLLPPATGSSICQLDGKLSGTDPSWTYTGWKPQLRFDDVRDGLSHTLLIGEKYVHPDHQGEQMWGDSCIYNDDAHTSSHRVAGEKYPLAQSDIDATVMPDYLNMPFGSSHSAGVCHFVMCDGSVQSLSPMINSTVLGYLANREDGAVIRPGEVVQ